MPSNTVFPHALVLLPIDDQDHSLVDGLLASAAPLGIRRLVVCHVSSRDPLPAGLSTPTDATEVPRPGGLDAALQRLRPALPDVTVLGRHVTGEPRYQVQQLIDEHDIDIVFIGRAPARPGHSAWGSWNLKLLRAVACSVLIVPEQSTLGFDHAVVGMDFSYHAIEGLKVALDIADDVELLFQYDLRDAASGTLTDSEFHDEFTKNVHEHFESVVVPLLEQRRLPRLRAVEGPKASQVLVEHAQQRLIVMGSLGLSPTAASLLGSTAEAVGGRAQGPVLIWRKKGERLGLVEALIHR